MPLWTYDFTGTNGAAWSGTYFGFQSGGVTIQGNRGEILTGNSAFDTKYAYLLTSQLPDGIFELRFDVQFSYVTAGWFAPTIIGEGDCELDPSSGAIRISAASQNGNIGAVATTDVLHYAIAADGTWRGLKVWRNADPEPSAWTLEGTVAGSIGPSTEFAYTSKTGGGGVGFSSFIDNIEMYDALVVPAPPTIVVTPDDMVVLTPDGLSVVTPDHIESGTTYDEPVDTTVNATTTLTDTAVRIEVLDTSVATTTTLTDAAARVEALGTTVTTTTALTDLAVRTEALETSVTTTTTLTALAIRTEVFDTSGIITTTLGDLAVRLELLDSSLTTTTEVTDTLTGPATVPDAISDLAGVAGNQQVSLTWTAPADGGAAITDYKVQYREVLV